MADNHFISDVELGERLKTGDESALEIIYERYWEKLFICSFNILKDRQACEDILQEIFIRIWNNRNKIEFSVSLKAYLFAATRYEVYRHIRHGSVTEEIFTQLHDRLHTPSFHGHIEHKELIRQIDFIIDSLPPKCKEVYKLSREEQLSHKEIASRLNISTKTVENQLTKALRHLRTSLGVFLIFEIIHQLTKK